MFPIAAAVATRGSLMRGGAAFSPLSLSPAALWLPQPPFVFEKEDGTVAAAPAGALGYIGDQSGNDRHLIQATAGNRLVYNTSGGLDWAEFPAADDFLLATFALNQPFTRVSAWRMSADTAAQLFYPAPEMIIDAGVSGGAVSIYNGTDVVSSGVVVSDGTDFVAVEIFNGPSSSVQIDNNATGTGNAGATNISAVGIGAAESRGSLLNGRFWGGIIIPGVASAGNIALLKTYFAALYGGVL